jgi:HK97 gp10 family phage protein
MSTFGRLIQPKAGYGYIWQKVEGLKELDAKLTELGPKIARKLGNSATRKGAQVIRDQARENARHFKGKYTTGFIEQNIIQFRPRRSRKTGYQLITNAMNVGVRLKGKGATRPRRRKGVLKDYPAYYWFMVHFGTRFQRKQDFLSQAFDTKKHQAQTIMIDELRQKIAKEYSKR